MSGDESEGMASAPTERFAIGISFGNSNSSIAYTSADGKAEVIANEEGDRQIPSILSYIEGEEYHGTQAKSQLVRNSKNTVAYFRDYLGKSFDSIDPTPCHASAHPQNHESSVAFSIQDTESDIQNSVTVSEITTRHLRRLASSASAYLGKKVNAAVITVPTDFSEQQKEALDKAAKEAGIEVLQFISEPVAALLAYDARPEAKMSDKIVVVADLGGTRSDVAVIVSRGGMYSILATSHDYEIGGAQLDQILIDHFAKEFMKKNKTDPRENPRSLAKLKLEAEGTRKALSLGANASISVESLADGIDFSSTINRTRYETLANRVFGGFTRLIEGAVKKADLDLLDVDEVILSGGTSHTPKIARILQSVLSTSTVLSPSTSPTAINPSDLSARGAAFQASLIQEFDKEDIEQSSHPMVTVTPHLRTAVGVLVVSESEERGIFRPLLEAETAVPARRTNQFATPKDGGDVIVKICEGVRDIKVTKPTPKAQQNGKMDNDDESDIDSEEDEEEEIREKVWKVGKVLAEAAVRGVRKGGKVEVMVNVGGDLGVQITAREVGGKGGVRGTLEKPATAENGFA
ncbi:chaperone dnak [Lasallia pustulata]|uniref:Chaperone dnak n=1 Tax=Lasallia pustulata TaxID=136370 RepID=A0A1W5CUT8_9LECA|nr:chaperone dnak [Lasallia pustulata]